MTNTLAQSLMYTDPSNRISEYSLPDEGEIETQVTLSEAPYQQLKTLAFKVGMQPADFIQSLIASYLESL